MDANILQALQAIVKLAEGQKHDLPAGFGGTGSTNLVHGPVGIFGAAGIDQQIFSTRIRPKGLPAVLPSRGSIDTSPLVGYLTGFTDTESGDEPAAPCDDPLEAGNLKSCLQGSAFGRIPRKTAPLALVDLGTRVNRGEMMDLMMVNDPLLEPSFAIPGIPTGMSQAFNNEFAARLLTLGSSFENAIYPMVWTGAVANNTANNGYMEFVGLETLVGTGKIDVLSDTSCPSLDSDVKDFNYACVETSPDELFSVMTMLYRFVKRNAVGMGFMPVQWAWVMREDLFNQITDVWPCAYNTYRCVSTDTSNTSTFDAVAARNFSDEMRNGKFLKIDGVNIPVIIDDGIPEDTSTTNANVNEASYASDIYLLPMTVRSNIQVLFFEYRDYNSGLPQVLADARLGNVAYISDGGRWLWWTQFTNGCFSAAATIEPRIRLLTPQLAGRLQNVCYSPLQHLRQPFYDDPYFVDGGDETRSNAPYAVTDVG